MLNLAIRCRSCAQEVIFCSIREGEIYSAAICPACLYDHKLNVEVRPDGLSEGLHAEAVCRTKDRKKLKRVSPP
jgi:hypothetical protein